MALLADMLRHDDLRDRACRLAIVAHPRTRAHVQRILSRRPQQAARSLDALDAPTDNNPVRSLTHLLWQDLQTAEENEPTGVMPVTQKRHKLAYFLRRRTLDRLSQVQGRGIDTDIEVPMAWRALLGFDAATIRARCIELGTVVTACACVERSRKDLMKWLQPLGAEYAGLVLERVGDEQVKQRSPAFAEGAVEAYTQAAKSRRGDRLLSQVGRVLLGTAFQALSVPQRQAAYSACRSNLVTLLNQAEAPRAWAEHEQYTHGQAWIDAALSQEPTS